MPNTKTDNTNSFETNYQKLEQLIKSLEGGNLSLEKSINAYEEGLKLHKLCQQKLEQAELKIKKLTEP